MSQPDPKWGQADPTHDPRILAGFSPRSTDVLITTAPKAGTTWMQQILHQLRSGGDEQFLNIDNVVPWLELPRPEIGIETRLQQLEQMENPRLFKTHCTYQQTPGVDIARIILTFRDPRDCCISFYHHLMDMTDEACAKHQIQRPENLDQHVERWLAFASWYRNVASWWPHRHQQNILLLRYQDLVHDLSATMDQILQFLHWQITPEQKQRALTYASFPWMKLHAERFMLQRDGKPVFKPGGFIRRGQNGDGKIHLSTAQEQQILQRAYDMFDKECLEFIGI